MGRGGGHGSLQRLRRTHGVALRDERREEEAIRGRAGGKRQYASTWSGRILKAQAYGGIELLLLLLFPVANTIPPGARHIWADQMVVPALP